MGGGARVCGRSPWGLDKQLAASTGRSAKASHNDKQSRQEPVARHSFNFTDERKHRFSSRIRLPSAGVSVEQWKYLQGHRHMARQHSAFKKLGLDRSYEKVDSKTKSRKPFYNRIPQSA